MLLVAELLVRVSCPQYFSWILFLEYMGVSMCVICKEFLTTVGKQALFSPEIVWISVKAEEAINNLTFVSLPALHEGKKKKGRRHFKADCAQ